LGLVPSEFSFSKINGNSPRPASGCPAAVGTVIFAAFLGVGKHLVRLGGRLEPRGGVLFLWPKVWMVFPGQLAEGGVNLLARRCPRHAEDQIVILHGADLSSTQ
jgi:hypothetical protein